MSTTSHITAIDQCTVDFSFCHPSSGGKTKVPYSAEVRVACLSSGHKDNNAQNNHCRVGSANHGTKAGLGKHDTKGHIQDRSEHVLLLLSN